MPVLFQQNVNTVEALVRKWPQLGHVIPSADYIKAGLEVFHRDKPSGAVELSNAESENALHF